MHESRETSAPAEPGLGTRSIRSRHAHGSERSEALLWAQLRKRNVAGARFRRQHPLDRFIVDFCAPCDRLVVEVDGPIHLAQREHDARRQRAIEALGYRIVRVSAGLVERDVRAAVAIVRAAVGR